MILTVTSLHLVVALEAVYLTVAGEYFCVLSIYGCHCKHVDNSVLVLVLFCCNKLTVVSPFVQLYERSWEVVCLFGELHVCQCLAMVYCF